MHIVNLIMYYMRYTGGKIRNEIGDETEDRSTSRYIRVVRKLARFCCSSDIGVLKPWRFSRNTAQEEITWQAINLIQGRKDRA